MSRPEIVEPIIPIRSFKSYHTGPCSEQSAWDRGPKVIRPEIDCMGRKKRFCMTQRVGFADAGGASNDHPCSLCSSVESGRADKGFDVSGKL